MQNWFERAIIAQASKLWRQDLRKIPDMAVLEMVQLRNAALDWRGASDDFIRRADSRILRSKLRHSGFQKPADVDWAWRPELWSSAIAPTGVASARSETPLGQEVRLFHDCKMADLTIKQFRNLRHIDLAPFGCMLEVFQFDGSYLSLAITLPQKANPGFKTGHVVELETIIESERPLKTLARLNIKHGPNVEQIIREFSNDDKVSSVGFDLGYLMLHESRIQEIWLDFIFEEPEMNLIKIRDLTFYRRPRSRF